MTKTTFLKSILLAIVIMVGSVSAWGQTYYSMASADYTQAFTGWSGYATNWNGLAVLATGTIPVATKTTVATNGTLAVVASGGAIGYDLATSTKLVFLSTGATDNSSAVACDLNLNFTGRNAGTISFDVAAIANSTGNRVATLKLFYSTDGTAWTEITGTNLPYTATNNVASSASVSISLPTALNNQATVKLRFYEYNGGTVVGTPSGSRPKISLDNVTVTSTSAASSPSLTLSVPSLTSFTYNYGSGPSAEKTFTVSGSNLTNDISIAGSTNYEISTGTGASFVATSPITLTNSGGTVATTTIYARLKAGLAVNNYNSENIVITSTGATTQNVACSGNVACLSSGIAFASPTINKIIGDATFTLTPATSSTGTISYSSSVPAVASVDAASGLVSVLTVGTTVITASQLADATHCANTATYTLNVYPNTPTITVAEASVAAFTANVGATSTKTINVSGMNLSENISLALTGTNADQFSLSKYSVTQTGGTASNTVITITYTPTTTGTHTATLTLYSLGATDVTRSLSASAGLATPVANQPSSQNNSSFTANWDIVPGATDYLLSVYTKSGGGSAATDLFISEYVEGTSNNKALEIFNGTGVPVDLSAYTLKKQTNGAGAYLNDLVLSGTLANNDVYVIANSSSNASILAVTDLQNATVTLFNGNDAVALFKNGTQIDEVGVFNQVANWGLDQTLIRKSSITSPKATYDVADWDVQATDYITNLGSHTMTGSNNVQVSGSPFTVTGTNSYALSGLQGGTTYYYTVVAKNATVTTVASNEVAASTLATSLSSTLNSLSVSASDGVIRFTAESGRVIELYNAVGQKLLIKQTVDGLNSIPVSAKGLVVLKMGNQITKVVL